MCFKTLIFPNENVIQHWYFLTYTTSFWIQPLPIYSQTYTSVPTVHLSQH